MKAFPSLISLHFCFLAFSYIGFEKGLLLVIIASGFLHDAAGRRVNPVMKPMYVGFLFLATMLGQSARFEVASIRVSVPGPAAAGVGARSGGGVGGAGGACPLRLKIDSSRVDIGCATPVMLIGYAFRFPPDRITGPEWLMGPGSTRFDIAAKIPQGIAADKVPEMVRALLADRFGLTVHRGNTVQPIYALVVAKGGLKLERAGVAATSEQDAGTTGFTGEIIERTIPNADGKGEINTMSNPEMGTVKVREDPDLFERMDGPATTFQGVAELLDRMMPVSAPVVDMTGLKGHYQLVLDVSLNGLPKPAKASIGDPVAMEKELADRDEEVLKRFNEGLRRSGLQLERRRGPVETLVVDRWEKMPSGN
jgi:uncharacterized protein (TIGR03435 family)